VDGAPQALDGTERTLAMSTISRLTRSSLLVLLTATLTTAAYARGGGHAGSNAPMHSSLDRSAVHAATIHATTVHFGKVRTRQTIVFRPGGKTLPTGPVALGGGSHQSPDPIVRDHCSLGEICNTYANWQGEGGLSDGNVPAPNQDHQTGAGGQVNDHRTVVHDHRS
jgi:hypothetical protein